MIGRSVGVVMVAMVAASCSEAPSSSSLHQTWGIDSIPLTLIKGSTSDPVVGYARDATRLVSGTVVVADQYSANIRFFGADGQPIRSVGRRGEGPGEFGDPYLVKQCGSADTLFVWDFTRRKIVVMDTVGEFAREYRLDPAPQSLTCSPSRWFGAIGLPTGMGPPSDDGVRGSSAIWVSDFSGKVESRLGQVPFGENRALGKLTRIAAGTETLYVGTADSAWVDSYPLAGGEKGGLRIGAAPRAPTPEEYASAIEEAISVTRSREGRRRQRTIYEAVPMPATLPPYRDLLVDEEGLLWATVSPPGSPETVLEVVGRGLSPRIRVTIHGAFHVFEVGREYVLGALTTADGVQDVVVYRLLRS